LLTLPERQSPAGALTGPISINGAPQIFIE
jgi:hypothetical protein